jgi:hypothetical protein
MILHELGEHEVKLNFLFHPLDVCVCVCVIFYVRSKFSYRRCFLRTQSPDRFTGICLADYIRTD